MLNSTARSIGANKLATGHNLDDDAQTVLLNVMNGDTERLARLRPTRPQEGLIPRIKPLMDVPEREIALYAFLKGLPFHMGECPYARESLRGEIKDMLNDFEARHPGTKYSIMRGFDNMVPCLKEKYPQVPLNKCEICGEPGLRRMPGVQAKGAHQDSWQASYKGLDSFLVRCFIDIYGYSNDPFR